MSDLETAKQNLASHTICLCKNGECLYSDKRGIAPVIDFIAAGFSLGGYSAADRVVGKAAAMLFVFCGIKSVFAKTLSEGGKAFLEKHGVKCEYETLAEKIINRRGDDVCPMEKAVANAVSPEEGYKAIKEALSKMTAAK